MPHQIDLRKTNDCGSHFWCALWHCWKGSFCLLWLRSVWQPDLSRPFWQARWASTRINIDPERTRKNSGLVMGCTNDMCFIASLSRDVGKTNAIGLQCEPSMYG